ncbi:MAG: hypothetical protein AAF658_13060, partial [Myxococcota bacterium]
RDSATSGRVEFTNRSGEMQDVGGWRTCGTVNGTSSNVYPKSLPANMMLAPDEVVVVHWNISGTDGTPPNNFYTGTLSGSSWGSIAMYDESGSFSSVGANNSIESFVQWLSSAGRCNVGTDKGVWESCTSFVDVPMSSSICLPAGADPTLASSYVADATPDIGNDSGCN